jgi:PKD repeat protein
MRNRRLLAAVIAVFAAFVAASAAHADCTIACAAVVPATGQPNVSVSFQAKDAECGCAGSVSYAWTFGDGGTSTEQNPSHTYSDAGTYTVSLTVTNACGSDTNVKTGYVTVQDPCPNPAYTLVSAFWDTRRDAVPTGGNGYQERARLNWNADVTTGCTRSVFAKIYYRLTGTTDAWTLAGQSACYNITDNRTADYGRFTVSGLPHACYDFRIVLFECNGTEEKAVLEPTGDPDLVNECFEP